jgi:hypothetical protein
MSLLTRARRISMHRRTIMQVVLLTLMLPGLGVVSLISADPAEGFGTVNILGQRAEHERITRAALACKPGVQAPLVSALSHGRSTSWRAGRERSERWAPPISRLL